MVYFVAIGIFEGGAPILPDSHFGVIYEPTGDSRFVSRYQRNDFLHRHGILVTVENFQPEETRRRRPEKILLLMVICVLFTGIGATVVSLFMKSRNSKS